MYPHSLPPETRLMRRRTHQLVYMRPVVPDVCPWPMRFQCCPTLDLAALLAAPAVFSAEAADRACQPLSQDRVDSLGWWGCRAQQLFPWVRYCRHRLCPHPDETNAPAHSRTGNWTPPTLDIVTRKNKPGPAAGSPTQPPQSMPAVQEFLRAANVVRQANAPPHAGETPN
jgi:hypothetical protein